MGLEAILNRGGPSEATVRRRRIEYALTRSWSLESKALRNHDILLLYMHDGWDLLSLAIRFDLSMARIRQVIWRECQIERFDVVQVRKFHWANLGRWRQYAQ